METFCIHGHSGVNIVDLSLQDNVPILTRGLNTFIVLVLRFAIQLPKQVFTAGDPINHNQINLTS